jgi:solute carrier family 25 protein 39/40
MHRDGASVGVGGGNVGGDGKTNLSANKGSVFGSLRSGYLRRGGDAAGAVRRLWTGAGPTLARDVPYSALYWFAVEHLREAATETAKGWKNQSNPRLDSRETLCVHFFSGAVAGGAVAALTTPLDVVKTRVQIRDAPSLLDFAGGMSKRESGCVSPANAAATDTILGPNRAVKSRGLFGELAAVARHGGLSSLFAGWAPRAARAGPTCGIVLVAYEMAKNAPV